MDNRDITPTEIGKHPKIIKVAQEEMLTVDVLVCGRCLNVFHFIEDFKLHRSKPCKIDNNSVRDCPDTKPKIWAFLLWKQTQITNKNNENASWALYQNWVKMDENLRETWIIAGRTIQSYSKIGQGSLHEMPVKITKTVINNGEPIKRQQAKPQLTNLKMQNKMTLDTLKTLPLINPRASVKKLTANDTSPPTTSKAKPVSPSPSKPNRYCRRTEPNSEDYIEEPVEKIVAKRFNPRRKMYEFLVKWEGRSHDENTWELQTYLSGVPHLLEIFEKQLARQKENRALQAAKLQAANKATDANKTLDGSNASKVGADTVNGEDHSTGRPMRTSKSKAMDQVKQWVSNDITQTNPPHAITPPIMANAINSGMKRKMDEPAAKTIVDIEDDLIPSHRVKRSNGSTGVTVEVRSKTDMKAVKVNGAAPTTTFSGESLPVEANSGDVIITQDSQATGILKKPGINALNNNIKIGAQVRYLTKNELAVSGTGIIRVAGTNSNSINNNVLVENKTSMNLNSAKSQQSMQTNSNNMPTTITQRQVTMQRPPGGTIIQRKPVTSGTQSTVAQKPRGPLPVLPQQQQNTLATRSVAPRQNLQSNNNNQKSSIVTPEQKILQLSKSGDLKVTKKVITTEDLVAQRMTPQQRQQQLRQQQQQQPQSQVQIQKVQHITASNLSSSTRSVTSVSVRKQPDGTYAHEEQHQAQLCPVTGKLIGQNDSDQQQQLIMQQTQQQLESGLQSQIITNDQQHQLQMQQQEQIDLQLQQQQQQQQQMQDVDPSMLLGAGHQMLTNEDGSPILVTGEDGTVYQVAGKNAEGQTILMTQGPDGEQQFAYVASSDADDAQVLTLDNAVAEAVAQLPHEQQADALAAAAAAVGEGQYLVKTTQEDGTTQVVTMTETELAQHQALVVSQQHSQVTIVNAELTQALAVQTDNGDVQEANIPAEVVQADLPSPGGTRRVVLLLSDGTFMMTEMQDEEFKALNM